MNKQMMKEAATIDKTATASPEGISSSHEPNAVTTPKIRNVGIVMNKVTSADARTVSVVACNGELTNRIVSVVRGVHGGYDQLD